MTRKGQSPFGVIAVFLIGVAIGCLALAAWLVSPWGPDLGSRLGDGNAVERSTDLVARFERTVAPSREQPLELIDDTTRPRARGVVLVIGDGMGASQLLAGRIASVGVDGRLAIEHLPVATWVSTHSASSLYTDSAAAAAAMATGEKTDPGLLARRPDGTPLKTLFEAAREAGIAIASVTDTYVLDATPAAFLGHGKRRDYEPLAHDAARSGIEIIAGTVAGDRPGSRDDDLFGTALRDRGYTIVRNRDAWSAAIDGTAPVAGFFARDSIAAPDAELSLPDLATDIFHRVAGHERGFLMLVESEEADTGGHDNDFERVARGVATLDQTVARLVEAAAATDDVLIVVTADHETGGLGLTGGLNGETVQVRWATDGHTSEPVPLFASGPGADRFASIRDNTEIAGAIADVLALDLSQPLSQPSH